MQASAVESKVQSERQASFLSGHNNLPLPEREGTAENGTTF